METLPDGSVPLEDWVCDAIWAEGVLGKCPDRVIGIGEKKVLGFPLTAAERQYLSRWRRSHDLASALTSD